MAKMKWKAKTDTLAGYPAIRLGTEDPELCLAGRTGEVWELRPGMYKAFTNSYIAAKELGYTGPIHENGSEYLITCDEASLPRLLKLIGYTDDRRAQIAWADRR